MTKQEIREKMDQLNKLSIDLMDCRAVSGHIKAEDYEKAKEIAEKIRKLSEELDGKNHLLRI